MGWINLDPGETETRANPTNNQWFYFYAEANDGAFWAGPYVAEVSNNKFEKCTCLGVSVSEGPPPYYDVGFRELDTVAFSGVNFVPKPTADTAIPDRVPGVRCEPTRPSGRRF